MCHLGHVDTLCGTYMEEKKNIKVSTQVKKTTNTDAKHSTCLLFRCIRGGSRVEETAVSSQYSVYINAALAHAANLMLFLG